MHGGFPVSRKRLTPSPFLCKMADMTKKRNPLKLYLKQQGIKQVDFAALVARRSGEPIDPSTICRWLNGSRKPDRFWSREIEKATKGAVARGDW
jgi:hypothetical protein